MARIVWIVVLFLGIPTGIYFLLNDAVASQEKAWADVVLKNVQSLEELQKYSLHSVCYQPHTNDDPYPSLACTPYKNTRSLRWVAVVAAVVPILYSLLLITLSTRCSKDRTLLLRIFRPGIYVSTILVAILILVQWLLISGVFYGYAFGEPSDGYFWIVPLGIVALVGAFFTIRPILGGMPRAKAAVLGIPLIEQDHPAIWRFVKDLAAKADARPPDHLVVGFTPNFFVTEATVECLSGTLEGTTMYLSLPLCRILTTEELSAVVLHELSHFKGEDVAFSTHFYPIYRGVLDSMTGVTNASVNVARIGSKIPIFAFAVIFIIASYSLLPSVYLLGFFLESFSRAERQIGRDREFAADALAAQIQSPESIASVLVKLSAFSSVWSDLILWAKRAQAEGAVKLREKSYEPEAFFFNMSELFQKMVHDCVGPELLQNLDQVKTSHPTDTHPPLSVRLDALKTSVADTSQMALTVVIDSPGSDLINNVESLEIHLSEVQRHLVMA